jgi:hypothetical protein
MSAAFRNCPGVRLVIFMSGKCGRDGKEVKHRKGATGQWPKPIVMPPPRATRLNL